MPYDAQGKYHADPMWQRYQQPPASPLDALRSIRSTLQGDSAKLNPNGYHQKAPQTAQVATGEPIQWPAAPGAPDSFGPPQEPGMPNLGDPSAGTVANEDPNAGMRAQLNQIDPKTAPGVLEGLRAAGPDDTTKLFGLQNKLRDEIAGNLAKAQGAGSTFTTGATPVDLQRMNDDIAESPVTQYQNQTREAENNRFQFGQPAAQFGRAMEQQKANSPVDVARIGAQGQIDVQREREKGSDSFLERMIQMNAAGLNPGTTIKGPGGSQFSTAPISAQASAAAEKSVVQLTKELNALEHPSMFGPIPMENPFGDKASQIAAKKAEIANAMARERGLPPPVASQAAPTSAVARAPGTKGVVNGIPAVWDGNGWLPEGH